MGAEIEETNCRFLQGAKTDVETVKEIKNALKTGMVYHTVLNNYKNDGTQFSNFLTLNPVFDSNVYFRYSIAVQFDFVEADQLEMLLWNRFLLFLPSMVDIETSKDVIRRAENDFILDVDDEDKTSSAQAGFGGGGGS